MLFSQNLKYLRESNNVTQEKLAQYLKVSRSTITGYETRGKQPDYEKLVRIAAYFHVSVDYLLKGISDDADVISLENPNTKQRTALLQHYQNLSKDSKQKVFDYMELLSLKDQKDAKKKK